MQYWDDMELMGKISAKMRALQVGPMGEGEQPAAASSGEEGATKAPTKVCWSLGEFEGVMVDRAAA